MKKLLKRTLAIAAAAALVVCAVPTMADEAGSNGTIMWLSHLTNGIQYDATVAYLGEICEQLGYNFNVVYGDGYNDAAGNLQQVKNGMTSDTVGIIISQDGGLASIMEEYPDLYYVGYSTDMKSVFEEGGENTACLENDHFLGTMADGHIDGADTAKFYFEQCIEKGYKKVALVNFPAFAYPNLEVATNAFIAMVEEYNATAAEEDQITIVGEATTLMFSPLEDSWFLEEGHGDFDAIMGFCAGVQFIYPTLITAIANGICSPATKLVTSGFVNDEGVVENIGDSEEKIIAAITISPVENPAYSIVLLDNAITGNQYDDFEVTRIDSFEYVIDSDADIQNVLEKAMCGTADPALAQISVDTVVNELCKRNNPDATFAGLQAIFHDPEVISVDALANK